jgi:hypothetical protein
MSIYQLRFWFEHGGICIWGMNEKTQEKYGYAIKNNSLPISKELLIELNALEQEYATYLDLDYPPNPSPWTNEQRADFLKRATHVYEKLKAELGSDFEITNETDQSVI